MEDIPKVREIALGAVSAFNGGLLDPTHLPIYGVAVMVWLIMFCHMWSLRRTLSRVFFVVSQMQSQLDTVKGQMEAMKTGLEAATARMETGPAGGQHMASSVADGDDGTDLTRAVKTLASMHNQFFLNCEDLRSLCLTSQYTCDMLGSSSKQLHHVQTELEDLVRSHVALTAAVNLVLDKSPNTPSTQAAASTTSQPTAAASVVQELKDALDPLGQRMRALRDTLDTGLAGVTRQLADMDQTNPNLKPIQDSLKDLATRQETMVTVTDKNLEETKVQVTKLDVWCEKLSTNLQVTNKVLGAHQELVDLLGVLKSLSEKHREQVEKFEMAFRGKLTSITEELQTLKGQANNLHGTSHALLRGVQKGVDHQTGNADSTAATMANIAAAFGKPPIDSPGIVKILDSILSLAELVKEQEGHFSSINEHMGRLDSKLHDVKEKLPERPPYRVPPADQGSGSQAPRPPPQVIDLQSRIPVVRTSFMPAAPVGPGIATVTYSDGSKQAIREEDIRGYIG